MSNEPVYILGPCSMENEELYLSCAEKLSEIMEGRDWYYKASFDKANRTALQGKRGPGLTDGVKMLIEVKRRFPNIKTTTDVHEVWQVERLAGMVDVDLVQIPAFLCRQTDLLAAAGQCFSKVNIKKGQWINPDSVKHFSGKVRCHNKDAEVWITERGTFFGYNQLIVDLGAVETMSEGYDKVILDCTHSTQRKKGDFTGGDRKLAEKYLVSAPIFGYDGVFAECHPNPPAAVSDGDCQIYLDKIEALIRQQDAVRAAL